MELFMESSRESQEILSGEVSKVAFRSGDGAFCVIIVKPEVGPVVKAVGSFPAVSEGASVECEGTFKRHPKYGENFAVRSARVIPPKTKEGITNYLSSGMIKGVGKKTAIAIVDHLGESALSMIRENPDCLLSVPGIGKKRSAKIAKSAQEMIVVEGIMMWLLGHGLTTNLATRIYKGHGANSVTALEENPYILTNMAGIGFRKADEVAMKIGFDKKDPRRLEAAAMYLLYENELEGHTMIYRERLVTRSRSILGSPLENPIERHLIERAIDEAIKYKLVFSIDTGSADEALQLPKTAHQELNIARKIVAMVGESVCQTWDEVRLISEAEKSVGMTLDEGQKEAVETLMTSPVSILSGGPGVGKTSSLNVFLSAMEQAGVDLALAAPTGKAARRMSEATGRPAKTVHRLLGNDGETGGFLHNSDNPLDVDGLVIDEGSMLDTRLMSAIVDALPVGARLIIVGDTDQLPSVGPGAILRDLIDSGLIVHTHLSKVHRQAAGSWIIKNAHAINRGRAEEMGLGHDFHWSPTDGCEDSAENTVSLIKEKLGEGFSLHTDIQVLTAMKKGKVGIIELNSRLQGIFNPAAGRVYKSGDKELRIQDKIIFTRNNYDLGEDGVFNGTMGVIKNIIEIDGELSVIADMEGEGEITFTGSDIDDIQLAYALTVHKSQGSEFPIVIMPLDSSQHVMLTRNWLYTGVTRARKSCILTGSRNALCRAIDTVKEQKRLTHLTERLEDQWAWAV